MMIDQNPKDNLQCYTHIARLGMGQYGVVHLYQQTQPIRKNAFNDYFLQWRQAESDFFAFKVYKKPDNELDGVDFSSLRQITILQTLHHPNLARCHDVIYKRAGGKHQISVIMDFYLQITDILNNPEIISGFEAKKTIALHILQGLDFLHQNYIFHRDLKPENLFISKSGLVKIADFGFAKQFGTPNKKFSLSTCTMEYRAPEVCFRTHFYSQKSDIWSFGCILAYLFTNKHLFACESTNQLQLIERIFALRGTPNEQNWPSFSKFPIFYVFDKLQPKNIESELKVSKEVAEVIDACLQLDPRRRPSTKQLLKMPFFQTARNDSFKVEKIFQRKLNEIIKNAS